MATVQETRDLDAPGGAGGRRRLWVVGGTIAVIALIIVGIVVFSGGGASSTSSIADQQLASVHQVCQQWTGSTAPRLGNTSANVACTTMANWMTQQLHAGRMTPTMMWGGATALGDTCRQWMGTDSRSTVTGADSPGWCDQMVAWMEQHIGNWDNWMMH
ncbi:MAG TPA: hypothetical protein VNG12_04615, partial [Acidimicrobiales bacterium]|nr:hypothetical protein [Acidimicrobiales bacterium]